MPDLLKVLLIDDNPDDRLLIIRELRKLFVIDVEEIIDYQSFEHSLSKLDFDIVITDYQLRWTTGIEVLIRIKTINPLLPVIMFTGTGSEEIAVMAMKVGLDDYILKSPQHYVRLALSVNSAIIRMQKELQQKQAENALRISEENYRTLVENIAIGFARIDKDFNILMVNEAQGNMFGLAPEDFIGMKCYDLYDKTSVDCHCCHEGSSAPEKFSVESLTIAKRKDGSSFEVQLRTFPAFDDAGNVSGYIEMAEDISGRIRSERIHEVLFNIANAILENDDLKYLLNTIHAELSRIIDTSDFKVILRDEVSGKLSAAFIQSSASSPFSDVCDEDLIQLLVENDKPMLLNRQGLGRFINEGKISAGNATVAVWLGIPLKSRRRVIGALEFCSFDNESAFSEADLEMLQYISGQIALAIDNKLGESRLRESEYKFRNLIEQSVDGVIVINHDGAVVEWNKAMSAMFQIPENEALGMKIWDLQFDLSYSPNKDQSYRELLRNAVQQVIGSLNKTGSVVNEGSVKLKNGDVRTIEITMFPVILKEEPHAVAIYRDVTSMKKWAEEIAVARLQAEESDRLKTAFLSNISYEIRTPLNAIIGFAALLADENVGKEEKKKYTDQIFNNSQGLLNQFDNIIELSKIESGSVVCNFTQFDLNEFMDNLIRVTENSVSEGGNKLILTKADPGRASLIFSDPGKLHQVMIHLLLNAFKFTENGFIETGYRFSSDSGVILFVRDNGRGIPPEKRDLIFDRFRQVDEMIDRKYAGLGIGLNIVKKIVILLNGEISYNAVEPHGSEFTVRIPIEEVKKEQVMDNNAIDNIAATTDKWIGKKILIVEDVDSNYQFLAATLRRSGATLIWAKMGEDAVALVKRGDAFDLVLMDVQLSDMDGYEVTRRIKELRPDLPIVAQTAYAMVGEREKSHTAGCDDYLAKPIRPSLLIQTINKYL